MDGQSSSLDFAIIGHQDTWGKVLDFMHAIRSKELEPLSLEQVRDTFPWVPPRKIFHIYVKSILADREVKGAYIESFILPDQLTQTFFKKALEKVVKAGECSVRAGAKVVTLGGFTSIVLEGNMKLLPMDQATSFTTGNTLTASFIVKGVEQAAALHQLELDSCRLLIIGSTGDLGTACARYFSGKVGSILLCARRERLLKQQYEELMAANVKAEYSTDLESLLPQADLIISVASAQEPLFAMKQCLPHALVCDAGYPKNIQLCEEDDANRLWHGGMGRVLGGYASEPDYSEAFYNYPAPHIAHGCLLESMLLALEGHYEAYSTGRGKIYPQKMEEIWALAQRHGFITAPFFNQKGLWTIQKVVKQ
jgi:predicted amino acid dehydrogenase